MPNVLFLNGNSSVSQDEISVLTAYNHWNWTVHFCNTDTNRFLKSLKSKEIHFIITSNIDEFVFDRIKSHFFLSPLIYYAPKLDSATLNFLYKKGIKHCVVGDGRQVHLINLLKKLWDHHWKRIPDHFKAINNSPFANNVFTFIEEQPLKFFNINYMSRHFQLTEYQFREIFKKTFNTNFRAFKQTILDHYETVLLFEKKLTPGQIYPMLNYRNLSAFSRSFRLRHGTSWQNVMRLQLQMDIS